MATTSNTAKPKPKSKIVIESLAVRYRPKSLSDLVGQDHIATQIRGMLKKGTFPSTMLFNGESGCGKTTTARMISRYILCKNPDTTTHEPCGVCSSCTYGDSHPDVAEINMAEQRGIDDVRALIQSSKNMPTIGDHRVFIVDECFPAGTEVLIAGQYRPIEELGPFVGTTIESYNTDLNRVEADTLSNFGSRETSELIELTLEDGSTVPCTPNHPFWSVTRGAMVRADELQTTDELLPLPSSMPE
jgi:hypothetical protein